MEPALWYLFGTRTAEPEPEPEPDPEEEPDAPTEVSVSNIQHDSVRVTWTEASTGGDPSQFRVQITVPGFIVASTTVAAHLVNEAELGGLDPETTYHAQVRAENDVGNSAYTQSDQFTTAAPPALNAPTDFSVTVVTDSSVNLAWTDNETGEDGYRVYQAGDGGSFSVVKDLAAGSESTDLTGLAPRAEYCFYVEVYQGTDTAASSIECIQDLGAPNAPENLTTTAVSGSQNDLDWDPPSTGTTPDEYDVIEGGLVIGTVSVTSFSHTGLTENTLYSYKVRARAGTADGGETDLVGQSTRLNTPGSFFALQYGGSGSGGFIRFTWQDLSDWNEEYVLLRNGVVFRSLGANETETDVDNSDDSSGDEWTLEARSSTAIDSAPAGPLSGPWPEGDLGDPE